eukprot:CAMPEP_0168310682 /NCGR_PEP_ID=MMETSP0142_2-20121227/66958_1 /TAXON_ID=44445 /ORGANISM="Pseudo-nitzschia australis, Strain 10249 10 AB" /LENGTH=248 /DNA_ID=CAMNT_0008263521 /DNA_START=1079 /DNA_END=1825 /DNA_ORIENTATION=+
MKQSMSYWDKKDAPKRVVLDKQEAVGRNWGESFDSGCNISGLRKIHICLGPYQKNESSYFIIKRISLEFDNPSHSDEKLEPFYCFADMNVNKKDTMRVFEFGNDDSVVRVDVWTDDRCVSAVQSHSDEKLEPFYGFVDMVVTTKDIMRVFEFGNDDSVVRVDVWTDDRCVSAVQFCMESGAVSQLYGSHSNTPPNAFLRGGPCSKLVGIHGLYHGVIHKLGFTFAEVTSTTHDGEDISTVTTTDGDYN